MSGESPSAELLRKALLAETVARAEMIETEREFLAAEAAGRALIEARERERREATISGSGPR